MFEGSTYSLWVFDIFGPSFQAKFGVKQGKGLFSFVLSPDLFALDWLLFFYV